MIIQSNNIYHPIKTPIARNIQQPFTGIQPYQARHRVSTQAIYSPAFLGQDIQDCQKSRLTTGLAYTWAKTVPQKAFIQRGNIDSLKKLKKEGATIIFMCKHYGRSDFPSFIKLMADISDGPTDFYKFYPHLMRGKDARDACLKTSILKRVDKGLGAFLVDNSGNGKGKEALILSLDLVEAGRNILIFPESGSPLRKQYDPVGPDRQVVEPIKNGVAHIAARYLEHIKEGRLDQEKNVYVVPIGISGDNANKTSSSSVYVGLPINVNEQLAPVTESKAEYYEKISALNEVFQKSLQRVQDLAYSSYLRETDKLASLNTQESVEKALVRKPQLQNFV